MMRLLDGSLPSVGVSDSRALYLRWREQITAWMPPETLPARRDLGRRYPWMAVALHAHSAEMRRRIDDARRIIETALAQECGWRVGLSCGKDSTVLAHLLATLLGEGGGVKGMSVKDDLDYPGETAYLHGLAQRCGLEVDVLTPPVSLAAFLQQERISLVEDTHSRAAELSARWFYGLIEQYQQAEGYGGVLLGLRGEESRGRRLNIATHGTLYTRKRDGLTIAQPLANWRDLDVHAYLLREGLPLLPVYLCLDPGMEPLKIRKSWWVAGGAPARIFGHYVWLRRWWPALFDRAVQIDPDVAQFG